MLLFECSYCGLLFDVVISDMVCLLMQCLIDQCGLKWLVLFWEIFDVLVNLFELEVLVSFFYKLDLLGVNSSGFNCVIVYLCEYFIDDIGEQDLVDMVGQNLSIFLCVFKCYMGIMLVCYKNQLCVDLVCLVLFNNLEVCIIDICYEIGFFNFFNFNCYFQKIKGMLFLEFCNIFVSNGFFVVIGQCWL